MGEGSLKESEKSFHGFGSPTEALNFYYENVLNGRHPDGFEYKQEKALLEWLAERD
jgi:hypothetical protein